MHWGDAFEGVFPGIRIGDGVAVDSWETHRGSRLGELRPHRPPHYGALSKFVQSFLKPQTHGLGHFSGPSASTPTSGYIRRRVRPKTKQDLAQKAGRDLLTEEAILGFEEVRWPNQGRGVHGAQWWRCQLDRSLWPSLMISSSRVQRLWWRPCGSQGAQPTNHAPFWNIFGIHWFKVQLNLNKFDWIVDLYLIDAIKFWQAFSQIDLRYLYKPI